MYKIDISLLLEHAQCSFPASVVISNVTTGSRTILHMNRFVCIMKLFPHRCQRTRVPDNSTSTNSLEGSLFSCKGASEVHDSQFAGALCVNRSLASACGSLLYTFLFAVLVSSWGILHGVGWTFLVWLGSRGARPRVPVVWCVQPRPLALLCSPTRKSGMQGNGGRVTVFTS